MTNPAGFLEIPRQERSNRPVAERLQHWREFVEPLPEDALKRQAERCMDCGIPFCHTGCPVENLIPDWNELVTAGDWRAALERLHRTNNFPEFTGRICPAPCEAACTLNLVDAPVTIKSIECAIVDRGWEEGWIVPEVAARGTGKRIAIVGSGPAGLACAQQLARLGHSPTVFEKADGIGGLLDRGLRIQMRIRVRIRRTAPSRKRVREPVEIEIDHRRREQRQRLADDQAADHGVAERLADFRAGAGPVQQRHPAGQSARRCL